MEEIKLKPNTIYVEVTNKDSKTTKLYPVINPSRYIQVCVRDGKTAVIAGKTDKEGKLKKF